MKPMTIKEYIETHRPELTLTDRADSKVIIIVEVPHQRKACTYSYYDAQDYEKLYLGTVEEAADKGDGIRYTDENRIEKIEEWARHDLHAWRKLAGTDEVLAFIPVDHQRLEVWRSLTHDLIGLGIVEEREEEGEE